MGAGLNIPMGMPGMPPKKPQPQPEQSSDTPISEPESKPKAGGVKSMGLNIPMGMPGMGPPPKKAAAPTTEPEPTVSLEERQSALDKRRRPTLKPVVQRDSRTVYDTLPDEEQLSNYMKLLNEDGMFFLCFF
jgi:hypothetical protein